MLYFGPTDFLLCFNLIIFADGLSEGNETFNLSLSFSADVNYTYVGPTEATLVIMDAPGM